MARMDAGNDFVQPVPINPEHGGRFVGRTARSGGTRGRARDASAPFEFEEVLKNPSGDDSRRIADKDELRNFRWLYVVSGLLIVALLGRSAFLQIVQGARYRGLAEGNRLRALVLAAPRGILYDRNNVQLVENVPSYQLTMVPVDVATDEAKRATLFRKVAKDFSVKLGDLEDTYVAQDPRSFDPVSVGDALPRDAALLLQAHPESYPGIHADVRAVRRYADAEAMSHAFGYVGKLTAEDYAAHQDYELNDQIGKDGVEQSYESTLRGKNGAQNVEVDAFGQVVDVLATQSPTAGNDLVLSVDAGLQEKLYASLLAAAKRSGKQKAAAVAIDPRNGEILAYVSVPGYDVNAFALGSDRKKISAELTDSNQPLFDRPISGTYPPGSTFKPFVATGALQSGNITEDTTYNDVGFIKVGGQIFRSWKAGGQGVVNVIGAIANSVNTFFFSIGGGFGDIKGLGIRALDAIAAAFGFGTKTGVDLPGEAAGLLPTPEYKQETFHQDWFLGDTYNSSIGQGFVLVTPLQLANATAAVANGGTLWWPHIGKTIVRPDGTTEDTTTKALNPKVAEKKYIDIVRRGMHAAVTSGTARILQDLSVASGAKTGTAQFGSGEPNAWFTAFAPYDTPTIAIAVLVEQAGEGSDFSAPVANDVLRYWFSKHDSTKTTKTKP